MMRIILHDGRGASHLLRRACAPLAGLPEPADWLPSDRRRATLPSLWASLQRPRVAVSASLEPSVQALRRAEAAPSSSKTRPPRRPPTLKSCARFTKHGNRACQPSQANSLRDDAAAAPFPSQASLPFPCPLDKTLRQASRFRSNLSKSRNLPRKRNHRAISSLILTCCNA
ncbi:hypothetical protein M3J09_000305 [Ascochyta lentis]